jgi:transcriptional regulator with XRE-family HTH domain
MPVRSNTKLGGANFRTWRIKQGWSQNDVATELIASPGYRVLSKMHNWTPGRSTIVAYISWFERGMLHEVPQVFLQLIQEYVESHVTATPPVIDESSKGDVFDVTMSIEDNVLTLRFNKQDTSLIKRGAFTFKGVSRGLYNIKSDNRPEMCDVDDTLYVMGNYSQFDNEMITIKCNSNEHARNKQQKILRSLRAAALYAKAEQKKIKIISNYRI